MAFIRKNLLKVIEWKDSTKDTVVYRYNLDDRYEIMTGSTLVVRESQIAVFVHKGKIMDIFEPGTYTLSTENLPFLTKILSLSTGFDSPIKAEVYFVNTKQFTGQKWGTLNPITLRDREFGMIRLRGYGVYSFRVVDAKVFMNEMFGTNNVYTASDVSVHIRPMIIGLLTDCIAESHISLLDISANYKEFGEAVVKESAEDFGKYGLKLEKLVVENLSLPEDVEKALDERSKVGIMEDKLGAYTSYQTAKAIRESANNPNGSNLAGLGVGIGISSALGGAISENMTGANNKTKKTKVCPKCQSVIPERAKHCPECGEAQNKLCPNCNEEVSSTAKFCPNCGEKLNKKIVCPNCNEEIKAGAKFCANCGEKLK